MTSVAWDISYFCLVKKAAQVSISILLFASLGLTQIGAGFFHNKHDAHKNTVVLHDGQFAIQEHGEHCKLCAIDLITLYNEAPEFLAVQETELQQLVLPFTQRISVSDALTSDRAPPVFS